MTSSLKEKEKITKANYPLTSRAILSELNEYGVPGTDIITEVQTLFPEIDRLDPKYERDGDGNLTQYGSDELKLDKQKWDKLKILIWMKLTNSMNP